MIREGSRPESEKPPLDVSRSFQDNLEDSRAFFQSLQEHRVEPRLELRADLCGITEESQFRIIARRVKAFLETSPAGQDRKASIRCTPAQKMWELNVFGSDVKWENAEAS